MPAVQSKVVQYDEGETLLELLATKSIEILGKKPFRWQLEAAEAILAGKDVILDVGTGCGKSLCFALPLLLDPADISVTVSPLTALMNDQVSNSPLRTVAICSETMGRVGREAMYSDIIKGRFQQVLVSPEIATSSEFQKYVWSKSEFTNHLRAVNIDEAHCINIWGGSFRPDYAALGVLRGRLPKNVPVMPASATMPEHVLNDIRSKLRLSKDAKMVQVTNARPNVALSVRKMVHSDKSKADLRFLIPEDAETPEDIGITLVYCNQRTVTEDCTDHLRDWAEEQGIPREYIAFYHAHVGEKRKRELEQLLEEGKIRILVCTEALGMGCDLRNISRVILWGLPPTFCAFVQRAGRAGRDLTTDAEAILIVPKNVAQDEITEEEMITAVSTSAVEGEPLARDITDAEIEQTNETLDIEGVRVAARGDSSSDDEDTEVVAATKRSKGKRRQAFGQNTNVQEWRGLMNFVLTKECRRIPWDEFFLNQKKTQLIYGTTTLYRSRIGSRCCDNCSPDLFPVESINVSKTPGLKRGKKRKMPEEEQNYIRKKLTQWRDDQLVSLILGDQTSISADTIMDNDVIDRIAKCGEYLLDYPKLRRHSLWAFGHDTSTDGPNEWGTLLMGKLHEIYNNLDGYHQQRQPQPSHATRQAPECAENLERGYRVIRFAE